MTVTRDQVYAWLDANPRGDVSLNKWATSCVKALGGPAHRTVKKWLQERQEGLPPGSLTGNNVRRDPPAPRPPPRAVVPAEDLSEDDRKQAISIVRDARAITAKRLAAIRELVEEGSSPVDFDAREAQALLNYQRIVAEVIETHPGLMEMVKAEERPASAAADRRKRLLEQVPATAPSSDEE